jgi:hypothetical protein
LGPFCSLRSGCGGGPVACCLPLVLAFVAASGRCSSLMLQRSPLVRLG